MSKYEFAIDEMIWSFSRLNTFYQCRQQFKLQYIDCLKGESNFFAEYGSFLHDILRRYAKGELEVYELSSVYKKEYFDTINHPAPPNKFVDLNKTYYNAGLDYLNNFDGFEGYEILDVEKEFIFDLEGLKIKGFIDLLAKDKNNNITIIDHKSSDPKSAKSQKAKEYYSQMYLYSIPVKEEYGVYPKQLHINAFRKQDWFTIDFDEKEIDKIKKWVLDTVKLIRKEEDWKPKSDPFFCNFLCNFRNGICEYKPQVF